MDSGNAPERTFETDLSGEPPVVAIVRAVAAASNEDPLEMEPLNDVVNTEAINALCTPSPERRDRNELTVRFTYSGYRVRITGDGAISVSPRE